MYSLRWLRLTALGALFFSAAAASDELIDAAVFCSAEGGCAAVRSTTVGQAIGPYLPFVGVGVYSLVFAGTLLRGRKARRPFLWLAALSGIVGLGLLVTQWALSGTFCEVCLGADLAGLLVGCFAVIGLRQPLARKRSWPVAAWLTLWVLAVSLPPVVALSRPTEVPAYVRKHWVEDKITIVEVSDFECEYCRKVHDLIGELVPPDSAEVRRVRVPFPLRNHPRSALSARAFLCAEDAGKGHELSARLFGGGELSAASLFAHGEALGMDREPFRDCIYSQASRAELQALEAELAAAGVGSVPLVWINDHRIAGYRKDAGIAPYAQALARAGSGQPARKVPLPYIALGVVVAILVTWAGRSALRGQEV